MKKSIFLALAISAVFAACKKDKKEWANGDTGPVTVTFDNRWGDHKFVLGQEETNASGEKLTPTTLKYYVSNFVLTNEDGTTYTVPQADCYHLIDQSTTLGNIDIELPDVPAGNYTALTFTIGVDSLRNTADVGQRTGDLDVAGPAADMYWSWNSGYIFYKIEGISPASTDPSGNFWYHIGGYGGYSSKTFNNLKTVTLLTSQHAHTEEHEDIEVRKDRNPDFHMQIDAAKLFSGGPTVLKISENPFVMFTAKSVDIANNFPAMFALDHVHNE